MEITATKVFLDCWTAINAKSVQNKRKYRLIEQVGGSRSSKTWSNFQILFLYGLQNRNKIITVMRDTAADCRDKVEPEFLKWLQDPNGRINEYESGKITAEQLDEYLSKEELTKYLKQNKTEHSFYFTTSGSKITFTGTDDEDRTIGKSQNVLWINEPYVFSENVYRQLTQRTSDFIIVDWNPRQNHFIEKERLKDDTFTHRSTLLDNPFCPPEQKKQILSYQPIDMAGTVLSGLLTKEDALDYNLEENTLNLTKKQLNELKRCQYNHKTRTFDDYLWKVYGLGEKAEKPSKIYKNWQLIDIDKYMSLKHRAYYGLDYGFANPTACVEIKYDGDQTFFVRPLLYKPMRELNSPLGEILKSVGVPSGNVTFIWADSADKEPGSDISLTHELRSWYNMNAVPTNKPTYKARFEFISKCTIFYVFDKDFQNEYENYEYEFINNMPTERPVKKDDHYMNAFEYCMWGIKEYLGIKY